MGFDLEEIYKKHDFKKAANIIINWLLHFLI